LKNFGDVVDASLEQQKHKSSDMHDSRIQSASDGFESIEEKQGLNLILD